MWQVIAAALGVVDNVNKGNQAQYEGQQAAAADSLAFARAKDYSSYSAYDRATKQTLYIALGGLAFLAILLFFIFRSK